MKKFTIQTGILFTLIYTIISTSLGILYLLLYNSFFDSKVTVNLTDLNEAIAQGVDKDIYMQMELLENRALNYLVTIDKDLTSKLTIEDKENVITYLNSSLSSIVLHKDKHFEGIGLYEDNGRDTNTFKSKGYTLYFEDTIDKREYNQDVSIYLPEKEFSNNSLVIKQVFINAQDNYIFFQIVDGVFAYINCNEYFLPLFENQSDYVSTHLVMSNDTIIYYQTYEGTAHKYLKDYLTISRYAWKELVDKVSANTSYTSSFVFDGTQSYISFRPLAEDFSSRNLVLVHIVDKSVVSQMKLDFPLTFIGAVVLTIGLYVAFIIFMYRIIISKNDDIYASNSSLYNSIPYSLVISYKGKIIKINKQFKNTFPKINVGDTILDWGFPSYDNKNTILDDLSKQRSFTAVILKNYDEIGIKFMVLKYHGQLILFGENVNQGVHVNKEYRDMALFNKVTGLPNKNSLYKRLEELFQNKKDIKKKTSLVVISATSFRNYNRILGEKTGDSILLSVQKFLTDRFKENNITLYHINMDNFMIIWEDLKNYQEVNDWCNALINAGKKPLQVENIQLGIIQELNIPYKIGIFNIEFEKYTMLTADNAISYALLALDYSKSSNVNDFFTFDINLSQFSSRDALMEKNLIDALKNKEFMMVYQPQYSNNEGRIVGFEALIRWRNDKYFHDSPQKFIEMAESNGMIIDIGKVALEEIFEKSPLLYNTYDVKLSINVSPVQLLQAGFVHDILNLRDKYQIKQHQLNLEITETTIMTSFETVIDKIKVLEKEGFDIHLDDFGTGYSSLIYLKELPVSSIKIDKHFIEDLPNDKYSKGIVNMIANLAKSVSLEVVVEGVEKEEQNDYIISIGLDIFQGYLCSRAVNYEEAINLIKEYNIDRTKKIVSAKERKMMKKG